MTSERVAGETQVLRSTLAYLEREAARRAKGTHPGMMRFSDAELTAVMALLRREVEADATEAMVEARS